MRLPRFPIASLTLPVLLLVAPGCAQTVVLKPVFPPLADIKAVSETKPQPTDDIVTSAAAAARYDIAVEGWGDRVQAAGGRICRWSSRMGAKLPFDCPAATTPDPAD